MRASGNSVPPQRLRVPSRLPAQMGRDSYSPGRSAAQAQDPETPIHVFPPLPSRSRGRGAGGEGAFRSSLTGSPLTGGTLIGGSTPPYINSESPVPAGPLLGGPGGTTCPGAPGIFFSLCVKKGSPPRRCPPGILFPIGDGRPCHPVDLGLNPDGSRAIAS